MSIKLLFWGGVFLFIPIGSIGQICVGSMDIDGDGYYADVPALCPEFDPDDEDFCTPQLPFVSIFPPQTYYTPACCLYSQSYALTSEIAFNGNYAQLSPDYVWQNSIDGGATWSNLTESPPYNGVNSPELYFADILGFCDYQFRLIVKIGSCVFFSNHIKVASTSIEPFISSTSLCPQSIGDCEKVCTHSFVKYTVEKQIHETAFWQVQGAESYTIENGEVSVYWGEEGQGEVAVNIFDDSISELSVDCGAGLVQSDFGTEHNFAFLNAHSILNGPFEYSSDGGLSWQEFQSGSLTFESPLEEGIHEYIVRDVSGQTVNCSVEIKPYFEIDASVIVVNHPSLFDASGAIIIKGNYQYNGLGQSGYEAAVTLTNLLTGEIRQDTGFVRWQGPGQMSIQDLPPGDYLIEVEELTGQGSIEKEFTLYAMPPCESSSSLCIDIQPVPQANFSTLPLPTSSSISICQGQSIQFLNESSASTNVLWDFGDAGTSPDLNPTYTYLGPGDYEVKLIARNDCFCADTTSLTIEVKEAQIPDIQCTGTVCQGDTSTYSSSLDCQIFNWQVSAAGEIIDGGKPEDDYVTVVWSGGPIGTVQLQVLGCMDEICSDPVYEEITILPGQLWASGPMTVCPNEIAEYSVPNFGATDFTWFVPTNMATILSGQGTHSIVVQWGEHPGGSTPQLAQIEVEFENCFLGCSGQGAISVQMKRPSYISGPIEVCTGDAPKYEAHLPEHGLSSFGMWEIVSETGQVMWQSAAQSSQVSPVWDFPEGNYTVRLQSTNNESCTDETVLQALLLPPPPPVEDIIGASQICPQDWYNYEAQSNLAGTVFNWQITNGIEEISKTGQQINVQWGSSLPYQISVYQSNQAGCISALLTKSFDHIPAFEINGLTKMCQGTIGTYSVDALPHMDYEWSIFPPEAGGILEGQGSGWVEVFWQKSGPASLKITGCGQSASIDILVSPQPKPAIFAPSELCPGEAAEATTNPVFPNYAWSHQNGTVIGTHPNPQVGPGIYSVMVTDANGCSGETSFKINEKPAPETSLSAPSSMICPQGTSTTLYATDTDAGLSFEWSLDGNDLGNNEPILETTEPGQYIISATDDAGCVSSDTIELEICPYAPGGGGGNCSPLEELLIEWETGQSCSTLEFHSTSMVFPSSFQWTFFDAGGQNLGAATGPEIEFDFPHPGFFKVQLSGLVPNLNDPDEGCFQSIDTIVAIPLKARFEAFESCYGLATQFKDLSSFIPTEQIDSWSWDFGDPSSGSSNVSNEKAPQHVYQTAGSYTVTLVVTTSSGCSYQYSKTVEVHADPLVTFDAPLVNCAATAINFNANAPSSAFTYSWNFGNPASGDGNFSNQENAWHIYPMAGNYEVELTVQSLFGCENTISKIVGVESNNLSGDINPNIPSPICEGVDVNLDSPLGGTSWQWSNGSTNSSISVLESGVYNVTLTDNNGCTYSPNPIAIDFYPKPEAVIRAVELNEFDQPVAYHENQISSCEGEAIFLEMVGLPKYQYEWSDGSTGNQLSLSGATGNLLPAGSHFFTVTVTDTEYGCTSVEGPFPVTVHGAPTNVEISSSPNAPICEGTEVTFSVMAPQADMAYLWNTGQSGSSITAISSGIYMAQAINSFGCSALSNAIEIHAAPAQGNMPTGCITSCEPVELCLAQASSISEIQWYLNGEEVPAPMGNSANWVTDMSGEYSVDMTNEFGCAAWVEGLHLDIASPFEDIFGEIWVDVNGNGLIDPQTDTLLPGAIVELWQNNTQVEFQMTQVDGSFLFAEWPVGNYELFLNLDQYPHFQSVGPASFELVLSPCMDRDSFIFLVEEYCIETIETTIEVSACPNDLVQYLGTEIPVGGSEVFILESYQGCDSVITVSVEPLPESMGFLQLSTCPEVPIEFGGQLLQPGDITEFVLENQWGCDSILTVEVISSINDTTELTIQVCEGESIEYADVELTADQSQIFTLSAQNGCDSIVHLSVIGSPEIAFSLATENICQGTADGQISINISDGSPPYLCSLDGENYQTETDFIDLPGGSYQVWVQDANGCSEKADITIQELPPLQVYTEDYVLPCDEDMVVLRPIVTQHVGELQWTWDNGSHQPFYPATQAGTFSFEVEDDCSIESRTVEVVWEDHLPDDFIYVPNAFSPNNDGINDEFKTYMAADASVHFFEFRIFDRWGNLLFESNDQTEGWDGFRKGFFQNMGVYIWYVKAEVEYCGKWREIFLEGDVTLMR